MSLCGTWNTSYIYLYHSRSKRNIPSIGIKSEDECLSSLLWSPYFDIIPTKNDI